VVKARHMTKIRLILFAIIGGALGFGHDRLQHKTRAHPPVRSFLSPFQEHVDSDKDEVAYFVRPCRYADLPKVSSLMMEGFYEKKVIIMGQLMQLAELNRLQMNFSYGDTLHEMFVVIPKYGETSDIVGFCDVDGRPMSQKLKDTNKYPPRPYLSDLVVRKDWRRKGIASRLVKTSEVFVVESMGEERLFIRVEQDNQAAILMYNRMGYVPEDHPVFGVEDTTILLRRDLTNIAN